MKVKLINYMPNMVETMAKAVSKCYDTKPKESVVKGCIKNKHTSVTEHSMYVFEVEGVSRAFLAQLTRHRHLQFTVRSQRYTNESGFNYIVPKSIKDKVFNINTGKEYLVQGTFDDMMYVINQYYTAMLEAGIPKEDARFVLPNATEVKLVVSGNYRAWMEFCRLREDSHSQWEIKEFAFEVDKLIHEVTPLIPYNELFGSKKE